MFTSILAFMNPTRIFIALGGLATMLIVSYASLLHFEHKYEKIGADKVQVKWDKERADIKVLADQQKSEIDAAINKSADIAKAALDEKNAALTKLGLEHIDRLELTKRIGALNEKHNTDLANIKHNYDERMRSEGINSSAAMRQESERHAQLSRSTPECDGIIADYDTLKEACQLTTIDFNACRLAYDSDTAACGRYK